jgi:hypothetical protein
VSRVDADHRRGARDGLPAAKVADEWELGENVVLLAKSRIMKKLRNRVGDLVN